MLLVRARPWTLAFKAAVSALAEEGALVLRARVPQREALAVAWGRPLGQESYGYDLAADEVEQLVVSAARRTSA